jgi:heme iron utilization protein
MVGQGQKPTPMIETRTPASPEFEPRAEAKRLLRVARTGALATLDAASGAPLTTLVSVGSDYSGAPLFFMSTLAQHTKNLATNPSGSLLLTSSSGRGDPLNRPRLTIGGMIVPHLEASARARFLARNPKAKVYAGFTDFSVFRMELSAVHFNGGFARAAALSPHDILTDISNAGALLAAEATLLEEANSRDFKLAARLAGRAGSAHWRAIGLDPEGLDVNAGARAERASFSVSALSPNAWRNAIDAYLARG